MRGYSRKLISKIEKTLCAGHFKPEEAAARNMRLVTGSEGEHLKLYWLVDEDDGVIADAKFEVIGPAVLIGAAESACELLIHKNYDQARRISADVIDREMGGCPKEHSSLLNRIIDAIDAAAEQCSDIPFAETYTATPMPHDFESGGGYPGWKELGHKEKIAVLEVVIEKEIRPYIELDAGGIQIVELSDDYQLKIAYQGACTTCYSSIGSTLNAIEQLLQTKVDPAIRVIPDLSQLQLASHDPNALT
jgi:NifU-like protein